MSAGVAAGDVDLTGDWRWETQFSDPFLPGVQLYEGTFAQNGSTLTLITGRTGTIVPATGAFDVPLGRAITHCDPPLGLPFLCYALPLPPWNRLVVTATPAGIAFAW